MLLGVELRLLRQVADVDVGQVLHLAVVFLVHARHDAQHGGFARAVQPEQADLGAGEEAEGDVLDDLTLGGTILLTRSMDITYWAIFFLFFSFFPIFFLVNLC